MKTIRTIVAALSVLALAGIASNASAAPNFHFKEDKGENTTVQNCNGPTCVKILYNKQNEKARIVLSQKTFIKVTQFTVRFRDDATGQIVTKFVTSNDGLTALLAGLTAESGKLHTFTVQACFKIGPCAAPRFFAFFAK